MKVLRDSNALQELDFGVSRRDSKKVIGTRQASNGAGGSQSTSRKGGVREGSLNWISGVQG